VEVFHQLRDINRGVFATLRHFLIGKGLQSMKDILSLVREERSVLVICWPPSRVTRVINSWYSPFTSSTAMRSKFLFWPVALGLLLISCSGKGPQMSEQTSDTNSSAPVYEDQNSPVYKNDKFGFEWKAPRGWTKYAVRIDRNEGKIYFALPLTTDILIKQGVTQTPYFDEWSVWIFTKDEWEKQKDTCKDADYPCFFPSEIGRNEKYVFGGGQFFVAGGFDPCADEQVSLQEKYFCSVYKDIESYSGFSGVLDPTEAVKAFRALP
jgi:hypothetical protein